MRFCCLRLCLLVVFVAFTKNLLADTWYVRGDGAPHYSPNIANLSWRGLDPHHTCDGKHDAPWPAVGTTNVLGAVSDGQNQPCGLSDWRWLYDDQGTYNQLNWIIAGGDTVILDNATPWRVGWDGDGSNTGQEPWCFGWRGGPYGCFNPTVPSGTAAQHTRILGRNWANCSVGGQPDKSKMSELFGGHGVITPLNLTGAQYVDVQCVNITRHSQCILHGSPAYPVGCQRSVPLDDYDADGILTDTGTHDLLLQDLWIHGHTDRGIIGAIGGTVTANRVDIAYNGMAGWDFDDGSGTPSVNAVLKMSHSTIEWSGCNQEYPAVDSFPVISCYSQSTGGYGDGIGTPAKDGMDVYIDHSIFRYNTQDGEDFGHIDIGGHTLSITNSASYANNGGQFKWGPGFTNATFVNNISVGNCLRMSQPIPGAPSTFNANLADFCRAEDANSLDVYNGANVLLADNTFVSYAPTSFDIQCGGSSCANTSITFRNNIVRGYDNPSTYNMGGQYGGPGGFYFDGPLFGTFTRDHNIYYGLRGSCIANHPFSYAAQNTATSESCVDPDFVNEPTTFSGESTLDGFNFGLISGSPAEGVGQAISSVTTDFDDAPRGTPPTIGALEPGSSAVLDNLTATGTSPVAPTGPSLPIVPAGPVATTTMLSSGTITSFLDNVTLTSSVISGSGGVPDGTVTLYFGSYPIATAPLDNTGTASWVFPAYIEKLGLTAVYSGSSSFLGSTSSVLATDLTASFK